MNRASLSVAVLTCGDLGFQVAAEVSALDVVDGVLVVTAPYRTKQRSLVGKVRRTWRMEGPPGVAEAVLRRLRPGGGRWNASQAIRPPRPLGPGIRHLSFSDFHGADCIVALEKASPDLGVLAGTYILRPEVFEVPRLGTINLHSGKAPEYRGAAPGFWELYHGETEVGITIHEVVKDLDAGRILRQEVFPLDPAPAGDPLEYLERFRREVLRPNGVRLLVEAVRDLALGQATPVPQDHSRARTFPTPDYRTRKELRRRVAARRREVARGG